MAIKKICPFDHDVACIRAFREIKLLRHFDHDNIIRAFDIQIAQCYPRPDEIYLVQELMDTDLHRVIQTQYLSDEHCRYFIYQVLRGVKAIHSARIIHRDLKPSNILVNEDCGLKICDFGLARSTAGLADGSECMTEYVATRWYRAPEVMLTFRDYTTAIDMWSVGCILAEMLLGRPLFPGKNYHDQIRLILDILGSPTVEDYRSVKSSRGRKYLRSLTFQAKMPLLALFPNASQEAVDLLEQLLTFNPAKRITVEAALEQPYVDFYHDPDDEPGSDPIADEVLDFERLQPEMTREDLRRRIYAEVAQ